MEKTDKGRLLRDAILAARESFPAYVRLMAPLVLPEEFVEGRHLDFIADRYQKLLTERNARLMVALPPGSMKSKLTAVLFPSWIFGKRPTTAILQVSHTDELATGFGREVRNLIETPEYQLVFPGTQVSTDSRSAGRWETTRRGRYLAAGAARAIAGFRGQYIILDDVVSEQAAESKIEREKICKWYASGLRTRLLPGGCIIHVGTRWHLGDLAGHLMKLEESNPRADKWEKLVIPALLDKESAKKLDLEEGDSYWPEMWSKYLMEAARENTEPQKWNALYMQNPVAAGGNIFKGSQIKEWEYREAPRVDFVLVSCDTAYSLRDEADFSAVTVWGIFSRMTTDRFKREYPVPNMILLGGFKKRIPFDELMKAIEQVNKFHKPDVILVENKASGQSILQELQRQGFPVLAYTPDRDKIARANASQPIFSAGRVWMKKDQRFAQEVIDELESFPYGEHDDVVDSVTQAALYVRDAWLVGVQDEDHLPHAGKVTKTYWDAA